MFFFAFKLPHFLQFVTYAQEGIAKTPVPSYIVGGLIKIIFCYFVQSLGAAPSRNMTLISWGIAIVLMIFGWKHTYLVPELASIMMLFMALCVVLAGGDFREFSKQD